MNEITVVVEDGMVIEILSSVENSVSVEVLDLDTTDIEIKSLLLDQLAAERKRKRPIYFSNDYLGGHACLRITTKQLWSVCRN